MKRMLLAMIGTCVLSTSALALDESSFTAKVEKFTGTTLAIRGLCICKQAGPYYLKAGYLKSEPAALPSSTIKGVGVSCAVPLFYAGGSVSQIGTCNGYEVLGKK